MKLIIQSDDLGITEAVSCGIARAAREGAITCTGLFSNMPAAPFAVELMKPYPQICLGEDINLVAGRPCADPEKVPSLVQKNGLFLTSGMHWAIDQKDGDQNHVKYEDCLTETEAQVLRFKELTGKFPEYLHGHSYSTPATWAAMEAIGRKYSIPLVKEMHKRFGIIRPSRNWNKKPFPLEDQIKADLTANAPSTPQIFEANSAPACMAFFKSSLTFPSSLLSSLKNSGSLYRKIYVKNVAK